MKSPTLYTTKDGIDVFLNLVIAQIYKPSYIIDWISECLDRYNCSTNRYSIAFLKKIQQKQR